MKQDCSTAGNGGNVWCRQAPSSLDLQCSNIIGATLEFLAWRPSSSKGWRRENYPAVARVELKEKKELVFGKIPQGHLAKQMSKGFALRKASDDRRALEPTSISASHRVAPDFGGRIGGRDGLAL